MRILFNKPYLTGGELDYIKDVVSRGVISGNGYYTNKCHEFFKVKYGFKKCLLTTSCTDALEMAAILCDIQPGDEVIVPSYTFVSSANAFVLRGAKIVFTDSRPDHPGINEDLIEDLITNKTKVIIPVHYAGVACDMDKIMALAFKYNLIVVEDAAQAIDSFYISSETQKKQPLGSIGHLGCFSFHESKNIQCGEGGMLVINDERFFKRAEIIWEKGTNRAEFFRGEVNKYNWIDIGSSFLPSEITAAFLFAQLENIDAIQKKRKTIWEYYYSKFLLFGEEKKFILPALPNYASNNAHLFYLVFNDYKSRTLTIEKLRKKGIMSLFHYLSLHKSPYYNSKHDGRELPESERYSNCLLRLPLFYELKVFEQKEIVSNILPTEKD
jgi:dTDP-4-amino-4,6-dideoxygalactose transaminase